MNKLIVLLAFILFVFTSCFKDRIELDYNEDGNKKVAIIAWITTLDEPQFIEVSQTVNYLGTYEADKVSGAMVTLTDSEKTYTLSEDDSGRYFLPNDWTPRIGDDYELKVSYLGKDYFATHKLRTCPEIEDLNYGLAEIIDSIPSFVTILGFQDPSGKGDGYYALDYVKGTAYRDSIRYGSFVDDELLDGQYLGEVVLTDEGRYFEEGDTAVVEIQNIGIETIKYLQDIESEIYRGTPFDAPPENVRTNFEGGAIGYFIISDARRAEIVIE